jgi:hypothetical protein
MKTFPNKYASSRTNLTTLMILDTNLSHCYRLFCHEILYNENGVALAYQTRIRDNIHIQPTLWTFHDAYQLLQLPSLTSKTRKNSISRPEQDSVDKQQSLQNKDLPQIVKDVGMLKQCNTSANVCTIPNLSGSD